MEIIKINNPNDIVFPLEQKIFENPKILYHGTWSSFSKKIESVGWIINDLPYDMEDIRFVCYVSEILGTTQETYYGTLKYYTQGLGRGSDYLKPVSLSPNYWIARNFTGFRGGETIHHICEALNDLLNSDKLEEVEYLEKLKRLQKKYRGLTRDGYGVVYLVEVEKDWFANWKNLENEPQTELILKNDLPPGCIKARINFKNGVTPFRPDYAYPLPLPWTLDSFKRNLGKSKSKPSRSILDEYLRIN